ncbi:MAG: 50S ribosomal protein L30e [Candidatus Diapherotrites archaeon]|uniref:Large ribosomal subunit protein eL30 n=1 Tax=Candidatus Iainarchaeum sp. TaxID=3101447 RepID=A0A8T4KTT0_9ARCH|nr:50S ribosomal protein L30e [Candidatus Diapherotrites archaeon]
MRMAEEIDANREIRKAVDTGSVSFGEKQAEKNILKGDAQLVIISNNLSKLLREKISHLANVSQIPLYEFSGSGMELGAVCGKPFVISTMAIQNIGKSKILSYIHKKK